MPRNIIIALIAAILAAFTIACGDEDAAYEAGYSDGYWDAWDVYLDGWVEHLDEYFPHCRDARKSSVNALFRYNDALEAGLDLTQIRHELNRANALAEKYCPRQSP